MLKYPAVTIALLQTMAQSHLTSIMSRSLPRGVSASSSQSSVALRALKLVYDWSFGIHFNHSSPTISSASSDTSSSGSSSPASVISELPSSQNSLQSANSYPCKIASADGKPQVDLEIIVVEYLQTQPCFVYETSCPMNRLESLKEQETATIAELVTSYLFNGTWSMMHPYIASP